MTHYLFLKKKFKKWNFLKIGFFLAKKATLIIKKKNVPIYR